MKRDHLQLAKWLVAELEVFAEIDLEVPGITDPWVAGCCGTAFRSPPAIGLAVKILGSKCGWFGPRSKWSRLAGSESCRIQPGSHHPCDSHADVDCRHHRAARNRSRRDGVFAGLARTDWG